MSDVIKAEFAKFGTGATEKKITLALGELNKSDMRFGSKEVTSLTGATEPCSRPCPSPRSRRHTR